MEIMVTIAIIGILSAIVIGGLNVARAEGRDSKRLADIKELQGAMENYFDSCSTYPPSDTGKDLSSFTNMDCTGNTIITSIPTDPSTGASYLYYNPNTGNPLSKAGFHLCATLEYAYNGQGKAGKKPFDSNDPCDGTKATTFDAVGGTY